MLLLSFFFFFSSRRRHTRCSRDWSSDVCSSDLGPDLVVEVLSPDNRPGETLAKVGDWLEGGARLVWVIDPERRVARVYRGDGTETHVAETGTLDGEDVLPGFSCGLRSIL